MVSLGTVVSGTLAIWLCTTGSANADGTRMPAMPFVDGLWHGDIEGSQKDPTIAACWASNTFDDGTTFTLAERSDGTWSLHLSSPGWHLPPSHRYAMSALVDFYPRLHIEADARSETLLEIADLERVSLLGMIENGHTIDLASDGFKEKYVLEGSAKIIQRVRGTAASWH